MTNPFSTRKELSYPVDRVGGTNGGGRSGEATPLSEVLSRVLHLVGSDPLRWGTQEIRATNTKSRYALADDPDLCYLQDKLGLHPSLVSSMVRHYGRPIVLEAMRCLDGRTERHPTYFAAICRRLSEGRP